MTASSSSPIAKSSPTHRKILPPPSTFSDTVLGIGTELSKRYLFINIWNRLLYYTILIGIGSLLAPFLPLPRSFYFVQKGNLLNQYFVKLSWGWTLAAVGAFVYLTSTVYCAANTYMVRKHCARLVVGTVVWYMVTSSFVHIERSTGECSAGNHTMYSACLASGGKWIIGFDISGHTFLLLYCCLFMREEAKVMLNWERMRHLLDTGYTHPPELSLLSQEEVDTARALHVQYTPIIKGLFIIITVLHILWDCMLVITVFWYHQWSHKVAAMLIAYACWFVTYKFWYVSEYSPGMPGQCKFKYLTWKRST